MIKIKIKYKKATYILLTINIFFIFMIGCSNSNKEAGLVYGKENAPIEIINYTSFQCPDCVIMHERLHDTMKKYIENGTIKFIEKPIDIARFEFDEIIYKHMTEEQSLDFEKLLEIYTTQRQWRDFKSNEEVIKFLNLSQDENKKNINDLKIITKEKSKINLEEVPTMILNGKRLPINISEEEFINKVESLLRK